MIQDQMEKIWIFCLIHVLFRKIYGGSATIFQRKHGCILHSKMHQLCLHFVNKMFQNVTMAYGNCAKRHGCILLCKMLQLIWDPWLCFAMVCILVDFCVHFAKQNVSKMFQNLLASIVLHFATQNAYTMFH